MRSAALVSLGALLLGALLPTSVLSARPAEGWGKARELSVLYAGDPGSPRKPAFLGFLEEWFDQVSAINLLDLDLEAAGAFDVVIADWSQRHADGNHRPGIPASFLLPEDFDRPLVMIGVVAGRIQRSKINWL